MGEVYLARDTKLGCEVATKVGGLGMSRLIAAMFFVVLLTSFTVSQDRRTFKVGTASAARGEKATGTIEVPAASDAALSIPVAVVHGAKPGPVLALVAGAHGTEYTSIIALEKLIGMLNP